MRDDAIATPSKSGLPRASSRTGFDHRSASARFSASDARWHAVWPVDNALPRRGIRLDLDLVALDDGGSLVDEVRDQEGPALGAGAHRDVGAQVQHRAVGRSDHRVAHRELAAARPDQAVSAGWSGQAASTGWKLVVSVITARRPSPAGATCSTRLVAARAPSG